MGQYGVAQAQMQQASAIFTRLGDPIAEIGSQINLAVIYNQAGDHEAAVTGLADAQTKLGTLPEPPPWLQGLLYQAQAEAYLGLGELTKASAAVQRVIETEEVDLLPDAYRVYGEILGRLGQVTEAEAYLRQAIQLAEHTEDHYIGGYGWRALGALYAAQGKTTEAEAAWQQATALFEAIALANEVAKTEAMMSQN